MGGIADDILKRKPPSTKQPDKKTDLDTRGLNRGTHAHDVFLDTQPAIATRELARGDPDKIIHVDNLSVMTNTSPLGTEQAPIVRTIPKRITTFENLNADGVTFQQLAANQQFIGPWHDTQQDGTNWIILTFVSDQSPANANPQIVATDDINDTRLYIPIAVAGGGTSPGVVRRLWAYAEARYWRVAYLNGVTPTTTLRINATSSTVPESTFNSQFAPSGGQTNIPMIGINTGLNNLGFGDNQQATTLTNLMDLGGTSDLLNTVTRNTFFGGAFSGAPQVGLQNWNRARTPTIFRTISTTAAGNSAIWTPGTGNKFRLLGYKLEVTANASAAAAGVLDIKFQDALADLQITTSVFIPSAAGTVFATTFTTGFVNLGFFGLLSAAANNILNLNLSFALVSGFLRVIAMGVEE